MQLLETYPQDIKSARDYKPCAPDFFRWVVIGFYALVLLSAAVWGLFVIREQQQNTIATQDKKQLADLSAKIEATHALGAKSEQIKAHYEEWNQWLRGNYNLSSFLLEIYKSLPQGTRLQELTLKELPGREGSFSIMMRFFSRGTNTIPNTEDFEDKLTGLGVDQQDRQQSIGEGGRTEINATVALPKDFFPQGASVIRAAQEIKSPASVMSAPSPANKKGGAQ